MAGIILEITVDDKGSVKVKQFADESKKAFKEMTEGPKQAQGPLQSLSESWVGLTAKVAGATAIIYGIGKAFSSFVNEAAQAEEINSRLQYILEDLGYTWDNVKSAVDDYSSSIQKTTRFSDDEAKQTILDLMLYTNDLTKAQHAATLAMGLSIRAKMDLATATRYVGMGLSGNVEVLGRYIHEFRNLDNVLGENATVQDKSNYFLKKANELFGDIPQKDIHSYMGKLKQLKNEWDDLKKTIGSFLIGPAKDVVDWLKETTELWKGNIEILGTINERYEVMELKNLKTWLKYAQEGGGSPEYIADLEKRIKAIQDRWERLTIPVSPIITKKDIFPVSVMKKEEIEKDVLEFHKLIAEAERLSELGKMPSWEDWGDRIDNTFIPNVIELDLNFAKIVAEAERLSELGEMPSWEDWSDRIPKKILPDIIALELEFNKLIAEAERLSAEGKMPSWLDALEELPKGKAIKEWEKNAELVETFANNMGSAWNFNVKNIIKDSKNMGDAIRNVFTGMADAFTSAISKMISDWILFGSITGKSGGTSFFGTSKSGLGGIIGGIVSIFGLKEGGIIPGWKPISALQEGGVIRQPTLGMIGESGPEAVVPLKGGKIPVEMQNQGNTYVFISAVDAKSFEDMVKRNPGPIMKVIHDDARRAGPMRTMILGG